MFFQTLLPLLLAPLIAASPTGIDRRQFISANDLTDGNCKDTMFIFARGSTEVGNMVSMHVSSVLNSRADRLGHCRWSGGLR